MIEVSQMEGDSSRVERVNGDAGRVVSLTG